MTGLTYSSDEPIRVGDTVRRSRTAQSLYEVTDIRATGRPSVGLVPRYGYTRASAIGVDAVAALVLVEEARPTTDLGLDLPGWARDHRPPHQGRLAGGAVTRNTYHHNTTRT